jgi:hypothetical protein
MVSLAMLVTKNVRAISRGAGGLYVCSDRSGDEDRLWMGGILWRTVAGSLLVQPMVRGRYCTARGVAEMQL